MCLYVPLNRWSLHFFGENFLFLFLLFLNLFTLISPLYVEWQMINPSTLDTSRYEQNISRMWVWRIKFCSEAHLFRFESLQTRNPSEGFVLRPLTIWKNFLTSAMFEPANLDSRGESLELSLSNQLTNSMAYGTRRFNAAFTRALQ